MKSLTDHEAAVAASLQKGRTVIRQRSPEIPNRNHGVDVADLPCQPNDCSFILMHDMEHCIKTNQINMGQHLDIVKQ